MEIKDYLHFYIGQKITPSTGKYEGTVGVLSGINLANEAAVFSFELDGLPYTTAYSYSEIRPILRKLSDMTEEEKLKLYGMGFTHNSGGLQIEHPKKCPTFKPVQFQYLLSIGIDLFGLIDAGLAIDNKSI